MTQEETIQGILRDALQKIREQYNVRIIDLHAHWEQNKDSQYKVGFLRYKAEAHLKV